MKKFIDKFKRPKKIYIFLTREGGIFTSTTVVMLMIGVTYNNNLVMLISFVLLTILFITMLVTHFNLANLELTELIVEDGYANDGNTIRYKIKNSADIGRWGLSFILRDPKFGDIIWRLDRLTAGKLESHQSKQTFKHRGHYKFDEVLLTTRYPLGIFKAWSYFPCKAEFWVFPEPKGQPLDPRNLKLDHSERVNEDQSDDLNRNKVKGIGEFKEHRKFSQNDSFKNVDWKAYAKGRPLLYKLFETDGINSWPIDFTQIPGDDDEKKLSQLALWLVQIEKTGDHWSFRLDDKFIPTNEGEDHLKKCLREMAIYE